MRLPVAGTTAPPDSLSPAWRGEETGSWGRRERIMLAENLQHRQSDIRASAIDKHCQSDIRASAIDKHCQSDIRASAINKHRQSDIRASATDKYRQSDIISLTVV